MKKYALSDFLGLGVAFLGLATAFFATGFTVFFVAAFVFAAGFFATERVVFFAAGLPLFAGVFFAAAAGINLSTDDANPFTCMDPDQGDRNAPRMDGQLGAVDVRMECHAERATCVRKRDNILGVAVEIEAGDRRRSAMSLLSYFYLALFASRSSRGHQM